MRVWLEENREYAAELDRVIFCTFLAVDRDIYDRLMPLYFPLGPCVVDNKEEEEEGQEEEDGKCDEDEEEED